MDLVLKELASSGAAFDMHGIFPELSPSVKGNVPRPLVVAKRRDLQLAHDRLGQGSSRGKLARCIGGAECAPGDGPGIDARPHPFRSPRRFPDAVACSCSGRRACSLQLTHREEQDVRPFGRGAPPVSPYAAGIVAHTKPLDERARRKDR